MSVISDALKTAQRQKQLRESGRTSGAPLLVQLRPQAREFSWQRAIVMTVSSVVIVVSVIVMIQRMRPHTPLTLLPPVPSPLAGTPLLADPVRTSTARATIPQPRRDTMVRREPGAAMSSSDPSASSPFRVPGASPYGASQSAPTAPSPAAELPKRVVAAPAPSAADAASPTKLQGQPADDDGSGGRSRPAEAPPGRLRIAVEQPVTSDVARLFSEALTAHRAGNLAVARPLYERVLSLAPNDGDALNNLGVLLSTQRDFDRALELLRRAAALAPGNAGTWNNIGAALREQGHNAEAVAAFRQALNIDPQHQGAKVGLAQQYLATGMPAQARGLLDEALAANPSLAEAHYTLGQALELLGDRVGAIRSYSNFIRLAPPRLGEHVERVRRHVDSLSSQP